MTTSNNARVDAADPNADWKEANRRLLEQKRRENAPPTAEPMESAATLKHGFNCDGNNDDGTNPCPTKMCEICKQVRLACFIHTDADECEDCCYERAQRAHAGHY